MPNPRWINLQTLIDDAKCFETLRQLRWPEVSPLLANIALHGMEERIDEYAKTLAKEARVSKQRIYAPMLSDIATTS